MCARAGAPGDGALFNNSGIGAAAARARGAHQLENRLHDLLADGHAAHQRLRFHQLLGPADAGGAGFFTHGGGQEHAALGLQAGIVDIDLQKETVELRFGQGIGAFLLQRVLRRQHMKGIRQVVAYARHRDMLFLHRLQQRRLGTRRRAVDFVGHQQFGEDRPADEAEGARTAGAFLHHFRAGDVGGHQVGSELDARRIQPQHDA